MNSSQHADAIGKNEILSMINRTTSVPGVARLLKTPGVSIPDELLGPSRGMIAGVVRIELALSPPFYTII